MHADLVRPAGVQLHAHQTAAPVLRQRLKLRDRTLSRWHNGALHVKLRAMANRQHQPAVPRQFPRAGDQRQVFLLQVVCVQLGVQQAVDQPLLANSISPLVSRSSRVTT